MRNMMTLCSLVTIAFVAATPAHAQAGVSQYDRWVPVLTLGPPTAAEPKAPSDPSVFPGTGIHAEAEISMGNPLLAGHSNLGTILQVEVNGTPKGSTTCAVAADGGSGGTVTYCNASCGNVSCEGLGTGFQCKSYFGNCYCGVKCSLTVNTILSGGDSVTARVIPMSGALAETYTPDDTRTVVVATSLPAVGPWAILATIIILVTSAAVILRRRRIAAA